MFISNAYAQTAGAATEGAFGSMTWMMIIMLVGMFFLVIRPQQKEAKKKKEMMDALSKGDEVVTLGGMLGKVVRITDTHLVLEIANGCEIIVVKSAVSTVLPKGSMKAI
ncbi:preprotein translocase subunit YajC [Massilia sp. W12]|uniref:preprotein translocase subunit YajC n=1 Tax=Massilia sp. W12 TaxID=3126507 RepID=UPI0030CD91E0